MSFKKEIKQAFKILSDTLDNAADKSKQQLIMKNNNKIDAMLDFQPHKVTLKDALIITPKTTFINWSNDKKESKHNYSAGIFNCTFITRDETRKGWKKAIDKLAIWWITKDAKPMMDVKSSLQMGDFNNESH